MKYRKFKLNKAPQGFELVTMNNYKARIICSDRMSKSHPIVTLIKVDDYEELRTYDINGENLGNASYNLRYVKADESYSKLCIKAANYFRDNKPLKESNTEIVIKDGNIIYNYIYKGYSIAVKNISTDKIYYPNRKIYNQNIVELIECLKVKCYV